MKKKSPKAIKLTLNRETIRDLDKALGGATFSASNPCCPPTRPLTHCC